MTEIEQLRAELDEQCRLLGAGSEREARLMTQLVESQAREEKLREALHYYTSATSTRLEGCLGVYERVVEDDGATAREALALPHDDSALKERLKAERERIAKHFDSMPGREMFGGTVADEIRAMGDE